MTRNSSYNFCKSVVEKFVFLASVMICGDIGFLSSSFFFLSEEEALTSAYKNVSWLKEKVSKIDLKN